MSAVIAPITHARLNASAAHRWVRCPGSVDAAAGAAGPSRYAAEGTFAHAIAGNCLSESTMAESAIGQRGVVGVHEFTVTPEMAADIQIYLDVCYSLRSQPHTISWAELSLWEPLRELDPDMGGTADFVAYSGAKGRHLHVVDFKYGAGVYVEADGNEQLMVYALGAMLAINRPVEEVRVTVVQPRFTGAMPVRVYPFRAVEIFSFIDRIKTAANKTREPNAPLAAGDHCRFCPAAAKCPELERRHNAIVATDFDKLPIDPAALAKALDSLPLVKERIKAIEELAYRRACQGDPVPGYKLVYKKPVRRWRSEADVIEWAQGNAIDPFEERKVLSPAQLEKRAGKGAKATLAEFIESKSSGTVLVHESDTRPPAATATVDDFAVIDGTAEKE